MAGSTNSNAVESRVTDIVEPILADLGLDLFDLQYAGGRLKVDIDVEGGVDSEVLTLATRLISRELDETDPIPGAYTLEVSTPGLERRLRRPDHYTKSIGSDVTIKRTPDTDGDRRVNGKLVSADDKGFRLLADDGTEVDISYDSVEKARTVFEWGPSPKPGGSKSNKKAGVQ